MPNPITGSTQGLMIGVRARREQYTILKSRDRASPPKTRASMTRAASNAVILMSPRAVLPRSTRPSADLRNPPASTESAAIEPRRGAPTGSGVGVSPATEFLDDLRKSRLTAARPQLGGCHMPTVVKERVDSRPAAPAKTSRLGAIVLVLGIAIAGALLASWIQPSPGFVPATDILFPSCVARTCPDAPWPSGAD
jgi:hypothetical protein